MVCGCFDISCELSRLSQFNENPGALHYDVLRSVAKHLVRTKTRGLIYWRIGSRPELPDVPLDSSPPSINIDSLPMKDHGPFNLEATVFRPKNFDKMVSLLARYKTHLLTRITQQIKIIDGLLAALSSRLMELPLTTRQSSKPAYHLAHVKQN
jgi:hypothetical protein